MPLELISDRPVEEGLHVILQYFNDITDGLGFPLIVFLLYVVLAMGIYFGQKRATGRGDMPVAFAVSSYVMIGFTIMIGMVGGLINGILIVEVLVLSVVGTLWLYFSKRMGQIDY